MYQNLSGSCMCVLAWVEEMEWLTPSSLHQLRYSATYFLAAVLWLGPLIGLQHAEVHLEAPSVSTWTVPRLEVFRNMLGFWIPRSAGHSIAVIELFGTVAPERLASLLSSEFTSSQGSPMFLQAVWNRSGYVR